MNAAVARSPLPVAVFHGAEQACVVASEPWHQLFQLELPEIVREKIAESLQSRQPVEAVLRCRGAADQEADSVYRILLEPLPDDEVMATCIDLTELHEARAEAVRANQLKQQLLAAVSHDLRAPMSTILLWERVLRDRFQEVNVRNRALDAIRESATAQSDLISDLVEVSSVLSGAAELQCERIALESVLTTAVELHMGTAANKRVDVVRDYRPPLGHVSADRSRLRHALAKIVESAVRITPSGETLTIAARRKQSSLVIAIGNVANERRSAPHEQIGALELGLVLANEVLAMHGGGLHATRPRRGGAATFWVRLPLADRRTSRT
jgi:signal transduction histidine kinase